MEGWLREISRQAGKICRILTKLTEKYPETSAEVDLALYAAIKIQKTIEKISDTALVSVQQSMMENKQSWSRNAYTDPILDAAVKNIESFRQAACKLDINESQQKRPYARQQPKLPEKRQKATSIELVNKKSRAICQEEPEADQPSKSLSEIDNSILQIANQILSITHKQKQSKSRPEQEQQQSQQIQ